MMVVAVAMIGSLTVLPAMISKLGDKVEKGRAARSCAASAGAGDSRMWTAIINACCGARFCPPWPPRHSWSRWRSPALGMKTTQMGASDLPQDIPVMQTFNRIDKAFPFENNQATVVVKSD